MINFLISRNNTNSQSTEQQCDEKKENHQTRGYHLIEHHILKDIFITLVWQTVKRIDFNILEVKGLVPLRQPMVLFLPKLFLNWSLPVPIDFVTWYMFTVDHPDITTTDWQRVLQGMCDYAVILLLFFWFVCFSFSTLNTLISVCTFSKLFSLCFWGYWQGEFI